MHVIFADVVWPALLLEGRMMTWWAILIGLLVEYLFVRAVTGLTVSWSLVADFAMNALSAALGVFLIPIAGLIWEFFPGIIMYKVFDVGTFNPGTWVATILMAAAINTVVERFALRRFFKQPVMGWKNFWLLFAANSISIALAVASLFVYPPKM